MPLIQPDTSQAGDFGPIPPNTYPAKINDVEVTTSKSGGNPMIVAHMEVMVDGKPRTRKAYLVITGEGAYGFDQLLRATGFEKEADAYKEGKGAAFDSDLLKGQSLNVVIESDTYNNQLRDKIQSFLKA